VLFVRQISEKFFKKIKTMLLSWLPGCPARCASVSLGGFVAHSMGLLLARALGTYKLVSWKSKTHVYPVRWQSAAPVTEKAKSECRAVQECLEHGEGCSGFVRRDLVARTLDLLVDGNE
jgi:hypothetical protein